MDHDTIERLLARPLWQRDALYREFPELEWLPPHNRLDVTEQKAICGRCLVIDECLADALHLGPAEVAIRGGTTARERRQLGRVVWAVAGSRTRTGPPTG